MHSLIIAVWLVLTVGAILVARRARARDRRDGGRRTAALCARLGVLAGFAWVVATGYWFLPGVFNFDNSLPIHVCDLVMLVLPFALLLRSRLALALVWFVGVGLSSQGLITPVTREGPGSGAFWSFWISHGGVVGGGLFAVFGLGYRPKWRDYGTAALVLAWYAWLMLLLNISTGWNYGYVGPAPPDQPTVIDALGPWPLRLVLLSALAAFAMLLLMLPFAGPWAPRPHAGVLPSEVGGPASRPTA